jgi:hypothetical protein
VSIGEACTQDSGCASGICLGPSGQRVCTTTCLDDSDCGGSLRCIPGTAFGTTMNQLCQLALGAAADGADCTKATDCQSGLCVEGKCTALCPKAKAAGDACDGGKVCLPAAVTVDARFTTAAYDDLYGFATACVASQDCTSDPTTCAAPKRCVFRPTAAGAFKGFCLTPFSDGFADGEKCQFGTNCQSGLCVAGVCATPCKTSPDPCAAPSHCNATAAAVLHELVLQTAPAPACVQ